MKDLKGFQNLRSFKFKFDKFDLKCYNVPANHEIV